MIIEFKISTNEIYCIDLNSEIYWPQKTPFIKNKAWPELVVYVKSKLNELERLSHEKN
jgi:hypothetical protein